MSELDKMSDEQLKKAYSELRSGILAREAFLKSEKAELEKKEKELAYLKEYYDLIGEEIKKREIRVPHLHSSDMHKLKGGSPHPKKR